jgi:hypothetical protein
MQELKRTLKSENSYQGLAIPMKEEIENTGEAPD